MFFIWAGFKRSNAPVMLLGRYFDLNEGGDMGEVVFSDVQALLPED